MFASRPKSASSSSRRARALAGAIVGCVVLGGASAVVVQPACSLKNCESTFLVADGFNGNPTVEQAFPNGRFLDDHTWESCDDLHPWEDFGPQKTIGIRVPFPGGGVEQVGPLVITVHLSPNRDPYIDDKGKPTGHDNYAEGAGNIAEIYTIADPPELSNYIRVHNDSCGQYYVRVIVRSYASSDASTGSSDASGDASSDAPLDSAGASPDASADAGVPDSAADSAD
jgi:hypothetical protein